MDALSRLSLRNRALTALLTIFTVIAGGWATGALKQELFPSLQLPIIGVITTVPGANASVVEERVTKPMEAAVLSLSGVEQVTSTSQNSVSLVFVQLIYGQDTGKAQTDAQRAVLNLRDLPENSDSQVIAGSIDDFPIIQFSVSGDADPYELLDKVNKIVVPEVSDINGVRDVQVSGVQAQQVLIDVQQARLAAAGVAPTAISDVLKNNGVEIPAGTVGSSSGELSVQVGESISSLDEFKSLPLAVEKDGAPAAPVELGDVADVSLAEPTATSFTRTNGQPSLSVAIVKTPDGNTVEISRALTDMISTLETDMGGSQIDIVFDNAPFIQESISGLGTEGVLGLSFAVIVVFVFLFNVRLTLVTAISIPLSLLIALLGLKVAGFTLNIITLGALTITVGRVVDDSIVVIENIQRHLGMGEEKRVAIPNAVKEVAGAVTSSTLVTVAVFLPLALVSGVVGELFRPFALTVSLAILASLFVALTIVPVLGYWFLKSKPAAEFPRHADLADAAFHEPVTRLQRLYLPALVWSLRHKLVAVLISAGLLLASGFAATLLKTDFLGGTGGNTLTIQQNMPTGTSLAETNDAAKKLEEELASMDSVESYQVNIGGTELAIFTGGGSNTATYNLTLAENADFTETQQDLQNYTDDHPELGAVTISGGQSAFSSQAEIVITAPDAEVLRTATEQVTEKVRQVGTARDVTNDLTTLVPTVVVEVDRAGATRAGFSESAVGGLLAAALRGQNLGNVTFDGLGHDVILRNRTAPATLAELRALPIGAGANTPLTLSDVAKVTETEQPASLTRIDGQRSASVTATPTTDDLGALTTELNAALDELTLPNGAKAEISGVSADQQESFQQLGLAIAIAIAITYALLVATFKSLLQPLILLVSIPFAATGAIALLLASDTALGLAAIIGVLMLVGIVVTNAIVLIDLVNQYRRRGLEIRVAVIEGARHRLRPIVMTALATIFALTPMAFALTGGGAFISQPLAIVTIGGLFSSTALTLLLVPVLYTALEQFRKKRGYGADRSGM